MNKLTNAALTVAVGGGLVMGLATSAEAATAQATALKAAASQKNKPYKLGTHGPKTYDCAGLTSYAYGKAGKKLPLNAQQQYNKVTHISASSRKVGDLVFFGTSGKAIRHVGIYSGISKGKPMIWNANASKYRGFKVVNAPTSEYQINNGWKVYYGRVK